MRSRPHSILAGVVMRTDLRVDGLAYACATVGGDDATEAVFKIYHDLDRSDVNVLLLSGAVISWFNIIDIEKVFVDIQKPLICLTYEESSGLEDYIREYFLLPEGKLRRYVRLGARVSVQLRTGFKVYVRVLGLSAEDARILLNKFTLDGRIPEPVRVARLGARAALNASKESLSALQR